MLLASYETGNYSSCLRKLRTDLPYFCALCLLGHYEVAIKCNHIMALLHATVIQSDRGSRGVKVFLVVMVICFVSCCT